VTDGVRDCEAVTVPLPLSVMVMLGVNVLCHCLTRCLSLRLVWLRDCVDVDDHCGSLARGVRLTRTLRRTESHCRRLGLALCPNH